MNGAANDIENRETSAGRNTWYTYNKNETTGIREEGAEVTDMSGTTGQNLNISNIKFEGFDTAITNYETGVINLENVGFSNNALDIYNLGTLNLKGENTFTNGIGGKDSLGVMSIISGKTSSNSEINQQNVIIKDIASLTVDSDHLKSVTTNNGELNLGKGTLAYKVTGAGKTYISAGTEENKNKFSLADNVTIKQNSFSVLKAKIKLDEGTKLAIKAENLISNKPADEIDGNWIDVENEGSLNLSGNLLNVVIGKAEDKENDGLVNINSSISFGENGEIRNNTVNIKNDGVGLTVNADKITNSVIYVNDNSLTLTGGTNTNIIRKDFTPKAENTLGGMTYIGNSLNAANVINKEKIETDLFISNRANLTSELADLSGKISIGNLGAMTLAKDAVLAENRKIYGKGNVIIGNNSLVMKNNSSIEGMLSSDNGTLNLAYDNASVTDVVSIGALGGNLNLAIKMALSAWLIV